MKNDEAGMTPREADEPRMNASMTDGREGSVRPEAMSDREEFAAAAFADSDSEATLESTASGDTAERAMSGASTEVDVSGNEGEGGFAASGDASMEVDVSAEAEVEAEVEVEADASDESDDAIDFETDIDSDSASDSADSETDTTDSATDSADTVAEAATEAIDPADPSLPWFDQGVWSHDPDDEDSIRVVGVRFYPEILVHLVDPGFFDLRVGDEVIVALPEGDAVGVIVRSPYRLPYEKVAMAHRMPLPRIIRWAEDEDIVAQVHMEQNDLQALSVAREKAKEHGLKMKFLTAKFHQNEPKLTYEFTAEDRVDFRDLVKDLASIFHQRIELRQVGVRDHVSRMGGIGPCGREFCCATFLDEFSPITIRMAKDQDLSMNPNNISGCCGRLMCCLQYEHDAYVEARKIMPKVGRTVSTIYGRAKVRSVNLLLGELTVELHDQVKGEEPITIHLSELTDRDAVPNVGMPCPHRHADDARTPAPRTSDTPDARAPRRRDQAEADDSLSYDFSELGGHSTEDVESWQEERSDDDHAQKPPRSSRRRSKQRKGNRQRRSKSPSGASSRPAKNKRAKASPRKRRRRAPKKD